MTQQPNTNNDKERLEKIISKNFGLIVSQAVSFKPRNKEELEDLIQIGSLAMIRAANSFDEEKGKFSTFAANCIQNAIRNHISTNKNKQRTEQLSESISYIEAPDISELLPITLSSLESEIINLKLQNYSIKEIAEKTKQSSIQVRGMLQKIYKKIRQANEQL